MFWGFICYYGQSELVKITDSLKRSNYAKILENNIPRFLRNNIRKAYLVDDYASYHGTQDVQKVKEFLNLKELKDYPPNSSDLNPIEEA